MITQNEKVSKLLNAIKLAEMKANEKISIIDDGVSNVDDIIIDLSGFSNDELTQISLNASILFINDSHFWYLFLDYNGQGNRRTAMVNTACQSLIESGYNCSVKYIID